MIVVLILKLKPQSLSSTLKQKKIKKKTTKQYICITQTNIFNTNLDLEFFFFKKQSVTSTENSVKVLLFNKCKMLKGLGLNCI